MKTHFHPFPALLLFLGVFALSFQSCLRDDCEGERTFVRYEAIYKTVDEIRQDIRMLGPQELEQPGKIYFYDHYIFINELRKGIHIVDNQNPENPAVIAFIQIPGNVDMAVKDNMLYADNYIDLLCINIETPLSPVLTERREEVFSSISQHADLGHLVYYEATEETVTVECSDPKYLDQVWFRGDDVFWAVGAVFDNTTLSSAPGSSGGAPAGIGGSMARFTIYENFLYTIDDWQLDVFDINQGCPELENTINVGWGIETIYPYEDKLFIGANDGMHIFDNSVPTNPTRLSTFQHARACDPVVVEGNIAYITLRDGTQCQTFTNQLDVVDITDLLNPRLLESYSMHHPHGLAVKDHILYLCDGDDGLKVYDAEDPLAISSNRLDHVKGLNTYDAIALPNDIVLVVGEDGFYQFDSSDPKNMREISVIPVTRP